MTDDSLLAQLAQEFIKDIKAGKQVEIEEYARQHPELADYINELFPTIKHLENVRISTDQEKAR